MKVLLLLPDGVGIRNFIYTDFLQKAKENNIEVTVLAEKILLNAIENDVRKLELPSHKASSNWIELMKKSWEIALLKYQAKKYNDPVYLSYIVKKKRTNAQKVKAIFEQLIVTFSKNSEQKIAKLKSNYLEATKKLPYYTACKELLINEKPDIIFCTHQRSLKAVAPLLAAQELGIKNACFIYSWDNVPKATLFVKADHYLVWSDLMKKELIMYHSDIPENNIHVTGTPQFIPYSDTSIIESREEFAKKYNLPLDKKWVCYSGDDATTSPFDQDYLYHFADAINKRNETATEKLHIIFRRCPADFSTRYDRALNDFNNIITSVNPEWEKLKEGNWSSYIALKSDIALLVNTAFHCDFVVNLGSTMAFDFVTMNKPCVYIKYNPQKSEFWNVETCYRFVHFRSMQNLNPVIWVNQKEDWLSVIDNAINHSSDVIKDCTAWHKKITEYPLDKANNRILDALQKINK